MLILFYLVHYSFARPLLEGNYDIRTVCKFLGHLDVKTTILKCGSWSIRSPIDEP
jgi:site-specific recombinase XerD